MVFNQGVVLYRKVVGTSLNQKKKHYKLKTNNKK